MIAPLNEIGKVFRSFVRWEVLLRKENTKIGHQVGLLSYVGNTMYSSHLLSFHINTTYITIIEIMS